MQFSQKFHTFFGICMRKRTKVILTDIRYMEYNILTSLGLRFYYHAIPKAAISQLLYKKF